MPSQFRMPSLVCPTAPAAAAVLVGRAAALARASGGSLLECFAAVLANMSG